MTDKFKNIKSEEIKINKNGEIELSDELNDVISGGASNQDEEFGIGADDINTKCTITNNGCQSD